MKKAGIYIHIPFCQSKCYYCDFSSWSGYNRSDIARYFEVLENELDVWGSKYPGLAIETVYVGGGTPSFVDADYIFKLMAHLKEVFDLSHVKEVTIEVNPASLLREKAESYAQAGFNRASIGLQAKQDHLLKAIGRAHTLEDFEETYQVLRAAGIDNLSADLMFGLPGQTLEDVTESVRFLANHEAIMHISCYSLKIEEGTPFQRMRDAKKLILPDEDTERRMQEQVVDTLAQAGFHQYEISNFARGGYESRHNSSYWRMRPYLGFGLGAASFFDDRRFSNTTDMATYLETKRGMLPQQSENHILEVQEKKGDFMFLGLRMNVGVCDKDYVQLFGTSFFEDYQEAIQGMVAQELLQIEGEGLRLTDKGRDFANQVFMAFI